MEIRTLYRYDREGGGVTVSPEPPKTRAPYTNLYRVIADEGMLVTRNGVDKYAVIDTDTSEGWYEVEDEHRYEEEQTWDRNKKGKSVVICSEEGSI